MPMIDITKGDNKTEDVVDREDTVQQMETAVNVFCEHLMVKHNQFDEKATFDELINYISKYQSILYSPISNKIYSFYEKNDSTDSIGTMLSNLDELVIYVNKPEVIKNKKEDYKEHSESVEDAKKVVLKIWDHVNLANQQYKVLKQTDDEYNEKFEKSIAKYREDMTKDMNAQLLTMVGIFTALAFLIFGGISSLDNAFSVLGVSLLKLMCTGLIWGLCILNLIFVFLFCVGKMTKLNFKSNEDTEATIFQKYPIVWWSNLLIISLLAVCSWLYFVEKKNINIWFLDICIKYPILTTVVGFLLIGAFILIFTIRLAVWTGVIKLKSKD